VSERYVDAVLAIDAAFPLGPATLSIEHDTDGQYANTLPFEITAGEPPEPGARFDSVTPDSAAVGQAFTVTCLGAGLDAAEGAFIAPHSGGRTDAVSMAHVSDSELTVDFDTAGGTAGPASFHLQDADAVDFVAPLPFTVTAPAPTLTNVAPSSGPTAGGTDVTLTGTGFTGATGVDFNRQWAALNFVVVDDTTITCTTPAVPLSTTTVEVRVLHPSGNATWLGFAYQPPPPELTSVDPDSASVGWNPTLTLAGVFPDDMTGFYAVIKSTVERAVSAPPYGPVVKVDDTTATARVTMGGSAMHGTIGIYRDAFGTDAYTNTVPFTITPPAEEVQE
jgi:IPT/TIG domain